MMTGLAYMQAFLFAKKMLLYNITYGLGLDVLHVCSASFSAYTAFFTPNP